MTARPATNNWAVAAMAGLAGCSTAGCSAVQAAPLLPQKQQGGRVRHTGQNGQPINETGPDAQHGRQTGYAGPEQPTHQMQMFTLQQPQNYRGEAQAQRRGGEVKIAHGLMNVNSFDYHRFG